jgi:hypothetical protein
MRIRVLCLFGFSIIGFAAFAQKDGKTNVIDNVGLDAKKFQARQAYLSGDLATAMRLYTDIIAAKPGDAEAAFHIGECYQDVNDNDAAVPFFERAEKADPNCDDDLHLKLGIAYQQVMKLDESLAEFSKYKDKMKDSPKNLKISDVDHLIAEDNLAKDMMAHPVNVKIDNLGSGINSAFDDKSPSITADGKTIIFTSQRPILGGSKDKEGNEVLYDNVYISTWDSAANKWSLAYPVQGDVNELFGKTSCTSISPDGFQMFLFKNNATNAIGGDIFVARRTHSGRWGQPQSIGKPINTSYYEDCACLSPDGNTLYFISEKPGGYGNADIYTSARLGKAEWGNPVNIGPVVNTSYDEGGMSMAPDGKTMFFSSTGHNSMGSYDIFKTVMTDSGKWSTPVNLGYPINTVNMDKSLTISADTKYAYFTSDRKGGLGGRDIYRVDLSNYPLLASDSGKNKPTGLSILRGKITDPKGKPIEEAVVSILDSTNTKVATLKTNAEGNYFITLKANCKYKVKVSSKGLKSSTTPIHLPSSPVGTYSMTENIALVKN